MIDTTILVIVVAAFCILVTWGICEKAFDNRVSELHEMFIWVDKSRLDEQLVRDWEVGLCRLGFKFTYKAEYPPRRLRLVKSEINYEEREVRE